MVNQYWSQALAEACIQSYHPGLQTDTEDEIVSSDVIGIHFGSLFDATQTKVVTVGDKQLVKTVSWYDNEMSYVSQLVRTVHFFAKLIS